MCEREKRFDIFLVWWMDGVVQRGGWLGEVEA